MENDKITAAAVAEQMAQLRNGYLARLPAELNALRVLAESMRHGLESSSLDELHHRLHKLAGSGGTFGLTSLSKKARELEKQVKAWLDGSESDEHARHCFAKDVGALALMLTETDEPSVNVTHAGADVAYGNVLNVWLVEDDVQLGRELARQMESFNYKAHVFTRIDDAEEAAKNASPDILIMDVLFDAEGENATKVLSQRPNLHKLDCPLLFISSADDFQSRVRAAQLGADGYFLKPLDVPRLVNRMLQLIEQRKAPPHRVLIVDDDEELAQQYRLVLMGAGMEAEVLNAPETIIEKISVFRPELVLLDLHMPVYSGPDLAGVIRQHDKWTSLPVVYLSAETDLDRQIKAMDKGGDDFITKPISGSQLIAAVRVRIERARQLNAQISKDSLTGLLKHASIKEAVDLEVSRARRSGKSAVVAMLDIDHFKKVNDTYGHAVGDVVISSVAMLLRQRVRQSDIVGRYGGEEFVVLLPECDVENARFLLNDIRERFAAVHFSHGDRDFSCTISAGLACTSDYPQSNGAELLVAADAALYVSKRGGRNQVRVAPTDLPQGETS